MKVLIVRSSQKNNNKNETHSVFHLFCPSLPGQSTIRLSDLQPWLSDLTN